MSKDWRDISDDELLNFDGPQTAQIARYERIMAMRVYSALLDVRAGLHDVKKTMNLASERLEDRFKRQERIESDLAASQAKVQRVTVWLTSVIAVATLVYTVITYISVQAQQEANEIARQAIAMEMTRETSNKAK